MANKKLGSEAKLQKYGVFFVIPFIVIYLFFQLWPTIYTVLLAFTDRKGFSQELNFIGLKNFVRLVHDKYFWNLPKQAAMKVLELSKKDRKFVHVHIDSKTDNKLKELRGFDKRLSRKEDGKKTRSAGIRKTSDKASSKGRSRVNPHVSVERSGSAGLYKRKSKDK